MRRVKCSLNAQLLADARRITTGANVHDVIVVTARYKDAVEIGNSVRVKLLEDGLRLLIYGGRQMVS
jgi:hypothetical protein